MADVHANVRETRIERRRGGSGWGALIAFLVGGILIGAVAVLLMNMHGEISWPAGRLDFNLRPAIPAFAQPAQPAAPVPQQQAANPVVVPTNAVIQATPLIRPELATNPSVDNAGAQPDQATAPQQDDNAAQQPSASQPAQ